MNSPHDSLQATRALGAGSARDASAVGEASPLEATKGRSPIHQPVLCKADIARDDLTGLSLGPYALGAKLGGGGMGKIFAARHVHLERDFAIKFITSTAANCPEARLRFDQEVKALGKLQHPNIVSAVDAGCVDGMQYLATERIQGQDLSQIVARRGPLAIADACELIRQAALGLDHSHACGILHRDIKPSNLILDRSGVVKILDFGLVCGIDADHGLTVEGAMLGTLDFLSPEQAGDARHVDPRSDLYSLGCTLLYLLSGRPPFGDGRYSTPAAKIKGHLCDTPAWLERIPAEFPVSLAAVIGRMVAKERSERYASAAEVVAALAPWCAGNDVAKLLEPLAHPLASLMPGKANEPVRPWLLAIGAIGGAVVLGVIATCFVWNMAWRESDDRQKGEEPVAAAVNQKPEPPPTDAKIAATLSSPSTASKATKISPATVPEVVTGAPGQTANAPAIQFDFPSAPKSAAGEPFGGNRVDDDWKRPISGK